MSATISRMAWFLIAATVLAYAVYLVAGNIVRAEASGENLPIIIRDELGTGAHHLSGMIMVPSPCHELSVRTQSVSSSTQILLFRTWREPSVTCSSDRTPRYFRTMIFAPGAGVTFTATLDGAGFPILVVPVILSREPLDS